MSYTFQKSLSYSLLGKLFWLILFALLLVSLQFCTVIFPGPRMLFLILNTSIFTKLITKHSLYFFLCVVYSVKTSWHLWWIRSLLYILFLPFISLLYGTFPIAFLYYKSNFPPHFWILSVKHSRCSNNIFFPMDKWERNQYIKFYFSPNAF